MGLQAPLTRCPWALQSAIETAYHDETWGVPCHDPLTLFEFLVLEGAQAGLSWRTVLARREGYRRAFCGFDPALVAAFGPADVDRLLADPGIIRNRAKVDAAIANARAWCALDDPVGLMWGYVGGSPVQNRWEHPAQVPAATPVAEAMSRDLRRRGFGFVGPRICYAYLQACGMVNDHLVGCWRHAACAGLG